MVTHGPVGTLSLMTVGIGLAACALALSAQWHDAVQSWRWFDGSLSLKRTDETPAAAPGAALPKSVPQPRVSRIDDVAAVRDAPPPPTAPQPAPGKAAPVLPQTATTAREPASIPAEAAVPKAMPAPAGAPLASAGTSKPALPEAAKAAAAAAEPGGEEQPTSMELLNKRVTAYARQAQRQQAAGDYPGLARTCVRWADEDWRNPRAFFCAGVGLQGIGQHRQAIEMFNQANALLPKDDPLKTLIADGVVRSFRAESQR